MQDDERCCGTGTCIIDARGMCWCGQQWNGESMCRPPAHNAALDSPQPASASPTLPAPAHPDTL